MSKLFPITFSIPEEKIVNGIQQKTKLLSSLIPGRLHTYIYNTEEDYYNEYKKSLFATTTKKAGWDCMRHYEIMANGCIPYFPDIEQCPPNTMALLPKDLLLEGNKLYKKYSKKQVSGLTSDELDECNRLIMKLLDYTRTHLTTRNMADYILDKTSHTNVSSILYLSGDPNPDYLRCVTLHGFKTRFGTKCHDFPMINYIYKQDMDYKRFYGKGITYTNLLNLDLHDTTADKDVESDIKSKKYDIVMYGSYHRGMPYYDLVQQIYKPEEIIMLCGEDIHRCNYNDYVTKGHNVFVREL